jgi:hypothetical protein
MVVLLGILRFARAAGEFAMVQISLLVSNENGSGCWRGWVSSTIFSSEHFYYRVGIVSQFILIQSVVSHTYTPRALTTLANYYLPPPQATFRRLRTLARRQIVFDSSPPPQP